MASTVEMCNSALNMLGASNIISLTEDSKNARLLNQRYVSARDAVFRSHNWNCLIKRVELAADTDVPAFEFTHQYTLPSDCLRVIRTQYSNDVDSDIFKIEGRKLLTNESEIKIIYLSRNTDVNEYDSLLQEAIAARLASELAYAITQSNSVMQLMQGIYENKIREARFMDATEGTADKLEANEFITARF